MTGTRCAFCGHEAEFVHVHGHYQCPVCKTNSMPCCDGDNCESNNFFKNEDISQLQTPNAKLIYPYGSPGGNNH